MISPLLLSGSPLYPQPASLMRLGQFDGTSVAVLIGGGSADCLRCCVPFLDGYTSHSVELTGADTALVLR
jgi:hypothetical protein